MKNTFFKHKFNTFLVKSDGPLGRGDVVTVLTQNGKAVECVIHNEIGQRGGFFYYSQTRANGGTSQTRAKYKSEAYIKSSENAKAKSQSYFEKSMNGKEFLSLGEPIKVGHHSEAKHRRILEKNWASMGKSVEFEEKSREYDDKAVHWDKKSKEIDLTMPESIEFFTKALESKKVERDGMKDGSIKREHSFSLQYANKAVKDLALKLEFAKKMWGIPPVEIPAAPVPIPAPELAPVAPAFELSAPVAPDESSATPAPAKKAPAQNPAERAEIMRASYAAAESFELGGDPLDNLTGQGAFFF